MSKKKLQVFLNTPIKKTGTGMNKFAVFCFSPSGSITSLLRNMRLQSSALLLFFWFFLCSLFFAPETMAAVKTKKTVADVKQEAMTAQVLLVLPYKVSEKKILFRGTIQEPPLLSSLTFSPLVSLRNIDLRTGEFQAQITLHEGENFFSLFSQNTHGNMQTQKFRIIFSPQPAQQEKKQTKRKTSSAKKPLTKEAAAKQNNREKELNTENRKLRKDVEQLRHQLKNKDQQLACPKENFSQTSPQPNIQAKEETEEPLVNSLAPKNSTSKIIVRQIPKEALRLPTQAGIYVMPFVGRSQTYRDASRYYFQDEEFSLILAAFNGVAERTHQEILIPTPTFFTLLAQSKQEKSYQNIFRYLGSRFLEKRSPEFLQEQLLVYLLKNNMFKDIHKDKGYVVFEISDNSAIVFVEHDGFPVEFKTEKHLKEILVVKVSNKALLLKLL